MLSDLIFSRIEEKVVKSLKDQSAPCSKREVENMTQYYMSDLADWLVRKWFSESVKGDSGLSREGRKHAIRRPR